MKSPPRILLAFLAFCSLSPKCHAHPAGQSPEQQSVRFGERPWDYTISGSYSWRPGAADMSRIDEFMTTYPAVLKPAVIIVVPNEKWSDTLATFQIPATRGRSPAFTLYESRRMYLNADALRQADPNQGVEWLLAHEIQHLNDKRSTSMQERLDKEIDSAAREGLKNWLKMRAAASK